MCRSLTMVTRNVVLNDYSFSLYQSAISQCEFIKLVVLVENCDFDSVERFWTSHPLSLRVEILAEVRGELLGDFQVL